MLAPSADRRGGSGRVDALPAGVGLASPLEYLEGAWDVARSLRDERTGDRGSFSGIAVFESPGDGVLAYREVGALAWLGYRGRSSRSLVYRRDGERRARVEFADGRHFHVAELHRTGYRTVHVCGPDRYEGHYALRSADEWTLTWRVFGPSKSLVLSSTFTRVHRRAGPERAAGDRGRAL
ncbi:MAG TPA: DUF6314 family protein [Acidimicrobiales bacterium]|nr:DUF6314 family protein [Acidimicrobiales bacterium]